MNVLRVIWEDSFWPDKFLGLAHYVAAQEERNMTEEELSDNTIWMQPSPRLTSH